MSRTIPTLSNKYKVLSYRRKLGRAFFRTSFRVILLAASLGLAACSGAGRPVPTPTSTPSIPPTPGAQFDESRASVEILARGAELYTAGCQACHGDQQGQGRRILLQNTDGDQTQNPAALYGRR